MLLTTEIASVTLGVLGVVLTRIISPERQFSRVLVLNVLGAIFVIYLYWRITQTVLWGNWTFDGIYTQAIMLIELLWCFEVFHHLHFYGYANRDIAKSHTSNLQHASVDIVIPTYNEPKNILERTLMAASRSRWTGAQSIYVLDDGNRDWVPELCEKWGARCLTRKAHKDAKAGNINQALKFLHADFLLVLDADFLVHPDAINRLMGPMQDNKVAIVQAPQEFYNPDPIQKSLGLFDLTPNDQGHFFHSILQARNNGFAAFFCGTCALLRTSSLKELGGLPTESITEDIFLTLKLKSLGYETVTISEPVAIGLSAESFDGMITQRRRWGRGAVQMSSSLWLGSDEWNVKIGAKERFDFFPVYWVISFPVRFVSLFVPQLFLLFGWEPLVNATSEELVYMQGPLIVLMFLVSSWLDPRYHQAYLSSVWQDLLALRLTPHFIYDLFFPFKKSVFTVTPKGKSLQSARSNRAFDWIVLTLVVLTIISLLKVDIYEAVSPIAGVTFFWASLNLIRLLLVFGALWNEQPSHDAEVAVNGEHIAGLWLESQNKATTRNQCTATETRLFNKHGGPLAEIYVHLVDTEGHQIIARTDTSGHLNFYSQETQSKWVSSLVEAGLARRHEYRPHYAILRGLRRAIGV